MASVTKIDIGIKGISPLLMHKFPMEPVEAIEKKTAQEQAEIAAYRDPNGNLYLPGICLQRALVNGATYCKGKGRSSLQKQAAACLLVSPEYIQLGTNTFAIDSRPVVNPSTKGRIIRHRARIDEWKVSFTLEYDPVLLSENQVRDIIDNAGSRVGVLDFRPERKGSFGRFQVVLWSKAS